MIILPITIGAKWRNKFLADSSLVMNNVTLQTPAGTFKDTYLIHDKGNSFNYQFKSDQWIS